MLLSVLRKNGVLNVTWTGVGFRATPAVQWETAAIVGTTRVGSARMVAARCEETSLRSLLQLVCCLFSGANIFVSPGQRYAACPVVMSAGLLLLDVPW